MHVGLAQKPALKGLHSLRWGDGFPIVQLLVVERKIEPIYKGGKRVFARIPSNYIFILLGRQALRHRNPSVLGFKTVNLVLQRINPCVVTLGLLK